MNAEEWLEYYKSNRENRPEPEWCAPKSEPEKRARELARSLSHFQLGETGGGSFLFRNVDPDHPDAEAYKEALQLFVEEEKEHARLLAELTGRLGGRLIRKHWTHGLFRCVRKLLGLHFEIQVLVIAELVGTSYYRWIGRKSSDVVVGQVCSLLLKDEAMHVRFHREKLSEQYARMLPLLRGVWMLAFQLLFFGALAAAWLDHGACLRIIGVTRQQFTGEAIGECTRFLDGLTEGARGQLPVVPLLPQAGC